MDQSQDSEHLRLLSIFHYVVAAMTAMFALFPIIHVILGIAMLAGAFDDAGHGPPPPRLLGLLFVIPGLMIIGIGEILAICVAVTGFNLGRQTGYTFCLVVAAIECMIMPFGTALGVFTIVVLMRPSAKAIFDAKRGSNSISGATGNTF